eukprot:scaffold3192_cov207-Skeletonema_menzelii.AAC.1
MKVKGRNIILRGIVAKILGKTFVCLNTPAFPQLTNGGRRVIAGLTKIAKSWSREGYIAVVHDAEYSYRKEIDRYGIPAEVDGDETLNWFKVQWDGGDFPG